MVAAVVYDKGTAERPISLTFSYTELEAIVAAAKGDSNIKRATLEKLVAIKNFGRTKAAYRMGSTTITAS